MRLAFLVTIVSLSFATCNCSKKNNGGSNPPVTPPVTNSSDVDFWLTQPDQTALFKKQAVSLLFANTANASASTIDVDTTQTYQVIDGFGYSLTGGSATLINSLPSAAKDALLNELFGKDSSFIGVSYLRISIGASDLSASTFTYDDLSSGQTDTTLQQFSIDRERQDLIPVLKKIIAINPTIKILGSPWSPPTWMKTNNSFVG